MECNICKVLNATLVGRNLPFEVEVTRADISSEGEFGR